MGLVSQEPALFNDTIRANIAYGKDGQATESEIVSAAQLANAHKFISSALQVSFSNLIASRDSLSMQSARHQNLLLSEVPTWEKKCRDMTQWLESVELSCQEGRSSAWPSPVRS
ncbi:ABC transporter B family member 21 [Zea mays]|nr:ABC transporter B family member 21 [Zea mays]